MAKRPLATAIVHDSYLAEGGAERVLLELVKLYPNADVYLGLVREPFLSKVKKNTTGQVFYSGWSFFPGSSSLASLFKPLLIWYWESLDLNAYRLVISSSHSFSSKNVLTNSETLHASYIHTTPRYLYTETNDWYLTRISFIKWLVAPIFSWLRIQDFVAASRPDILIANSKTTQRRIAKYYRRESTVIYPPVQVPSKLFPKPKRAPKETYFICKSRLVKQKGIHLAIEACSQLNLPLKIIGTGPELRYLQSIAGPTIEFLGFVPDEKMPELYKKARALLYCSRDEDFGLVPVEALAHGVPVIAHRSGGVRESITSKAGLFFEDYTTESLIKAIKRFKPQAFLAQTCYHQALKFSTAVFTKKLKTLIKRECARLQATTL
jgi:glycosyltransferase involved in cell wall biosynthesis